MGGIVGNNSLLVKIGDYGEISYIFYPHVGYETHFFDSALAIYDKKAKWHWDNDWDISQKYIEETNIFKTILEDDKIILTIKDFVPVSHNVLIRRLHIKNKLDKKLNFKLFFYESLRIGENPTKNTVRFLEDGCIVKYDEKYIFCIGSDKKIDSFQCGNRYSKNSAYVDIENGILMEHKESYGLMTDSAISWNIEIDEKRSLAFNIYILPQKFDGDFSIITEQLKIIMDNNEHIENLSMNYWKNVIGDIKRCIHPEFRSNKEIYSIAKRALMTLLMLCDKDGGIIAAPSLHPDYRYVWGRDGAYIAIALDLFGIRGIPDRFFEFMSKIQNDDGSWLQNYYVNGKPRLTAMQIDQIGSMLWAMDVHYRLSGDRKFVKRYWNTIEKAGNYLNLAALNFTPCFDLWEEKFGVFAYTMGAIYAGLKCAYSMSKAVDKRDKVKHWEKTIEFLKYEASKRFYLKDEERFAKSINPLNKEIDTSILGLSYPFNLIDVDDERMIKTAEAIEKAFKYKVGGIGRYPGDIYFGGNPWIITTLWLSLYYRRLSKVLKEKNDDRADRYLQKSKKLFDWVMKYSFNGLFPEQIHKELGIPMSAMPLGWSNAMFLIYIYENDDIIIP
ncbi:glucoamylase/oligosaccharide amylase [Methanocaldococcus bathoardescens]|uniref:Glucoamylase/oligosaccharide amylase n=1 Tax=Methanocaldococcus bathoardescens TaxID=1301915 RepID=A0A076LDJ9_9EURY|nr:glycoside hydrolase family 15 protein [Methanocaldococcus bathoardescens]AIJ04877.1 glucoamylase/oligosaccharide amylase [Methanocaldococcus bathoardescens]